MDVSTAQWLVSSEAADALAAAMAEPDPDSLGAASRLRAICPPDRAAAVLDQASLRRRARAKMGPDADRLFWTAHGLEQATRPAVAGRRAARFVTLGAREVVDLGCGCGSDALAFVRAGLAVTAVDADPVTAVLAEANLGTPRVLCGDAEALAPALLADAPAVFCDPSRRTAAGRTWRVEDFTPSWGFVTGLLDGSRVACAKLGPGLPHALIPDAVEAEWVSVQGDLVEAALWAGPGTTPGRRRAVVHSASTGVHELTRDAALPQPPVEPVGEYVYEPDPAVIRAGLIPAVAESLKAWRLHDGVAYLTADAHADTPFATAFRVEESLPYAEKALRAWVRDRHIGVLEIKKRGIDVDPAALRKRLRPQGPNQATLILTPTPKGAIALVVSRLPRSVPAP